MRPGDLIKPITKLSAMPGYELAVTLDSGPDPDDSFQRCEVVCVTKRGVTQVGAVNSYNLKQGERLA